MDQILYIGITQSFFAGLMIATKRNPQVADRIMAAWLFLIAIEMGFAIVNQSIIPLYEYVFIPFTYGPLLYLYIKFQTVENIHFKWSSILHFLPFLVVFISAIVFRGRPVMRLENFWDTDPFLSLNNISQIGNRGSCGLKIILDSRSACVKGHGRVFHFCSESKWV